MDLTEVLADELSRHRDVIEQQPGEDPLRPTFRYGCTCGHERGVYTEREALARIADGSSMADQRRHVAARLAVLVAEVAPMTPCDERQP